MRAGHLHWQIADCCNYRCSYCVEGRFDPQPVEHRFTPGALIGRMEKFLSKLEKGWIVRLSSGEPSTHPELFAIAEMVVRSGHRVGMETNLSLPLERYERFVAIAGEGLAYLHVSFHPEEAGMEEFLSKAVALREKMYALSPRAGIYAVAVATPAATGRLEEARALFARAGLDLHFQRLILNHLVAAETSIPSPLRDGLEPGTASNRTLGLPCLAGKTWLFVDIKGDVWRCHEARNASRGGRREGLLGSIDREDVSLLHDAAPCAYAACLCPGHPIAAGEE
jgi:radical SAM family protein